MQTWQRWLAWTEPFEARLERPWSVVGISLSAILVLLLAGLPFGLWYGYGPERFEPLQLGTAPAAIDAPLPGQPAAMSDPGQGTDRLAPDIGLDLGPDVRVTLLFSVGSRDLSADDAAALRIADADQRGTDGLTDVLMLVIADPATGRVALLSLPRDLWLPSRQARINATWPREGTQALVDNISDVVGLPIHHLAQVNFAAFGELVDRLGGVAIPTDRALADFAAALFVPGPGCWRMTGADALAYVRSRKTLTLDGDRWVTDPSASDFGRIARQQQLLGAAFDQLRGPQLVRRVPDLLQVARGGLVVDQGLGLVELRGLASAFQEVSGGSFEGFTVPTRNERINGAAVLLPTDDVRPIMQRLRSWPPEADATAAAPGHAVPGQPLAAASAPAADPGCSLATADALPAPAAPLAEVYRARNGNTNTRPVPAPGTSADEPEPSSGSDDTRPEPTPKPIADPTSEPAPSSEPPAEPSPEPDPDANPESSPSPEPSPDPSTSPSPEPSDDDILPLP